MKNLMLAHEEWKTRPIDERFQTLTELKTSVLNRRNTSYEGMTVLKDIQVNDIDDAIQFRCINRNMDITNWALQQLCTQLRVPIDYLKRLPSELVAKNLNYNLSKTDSENKILYTNNTNQAKIRALTGTRYGRVWDIDIVNAVEHLVEINPSWHNPKAYKIGKFGDVEAMENAGLYASDRDIFMFMVDENHKIDINGDLLSRGFIVSNSEVGKATARLTRFLYRYVCGNHIIWDAKQIEEIKIVHRINAPHRIAEEFLPAIKKYVESSPTNETSLIKKAMDLKIADDKEKVIEWLTDKNFTQIEATNAVETAEKEEGDYTSLWNIVQGFTASARNYQYLDARTTLEKKAGKLLNLVN